MDLVDVFFLINNLFFKPVPPADLALSFYASPKETKDTPLV